MNWSKIVVHGLLLIYALILVYVVGGLLFNYQPSVSLYFFLSFALLFFALGQSIYELGKSRTFVFFIITSTFGFAVEVIGTNFGVPFGKYSYSGLLGEKVFGVPVVVPLIWFVISYITFSISYPLFTNDLTSERERKKSPSGLRFLIAPIILACFGAVAWDLMADPMFSKSQYWTWQITSPTLALSGVPLTNFLGWFIVILSMLSIFVAFMIYRSHPKIMQRGNTWDSRIAYILLMIDGAVFNKTLGNYVVIAIGVTAMSLFLVVAVQLNKAMNERLMKQQNTTK